MGDLGRYCCQAHCHLATARRDGDAQRSEAGVRGRVRRGAKCLAEAVLRAPLGLNVQRVWQVPWKAAVGLVFAESWTIPQKL